MNVPMLRFPQEKTLAELYQALLGVLYSSSDTNQRILYTMECRVEADNEDDAQRIIASQFECCQCAHYTLELKFAKADEDMFSAMRNELHDTPSTAVVIWVQPEEGEGASARPEEPSPFSAHTFPFTFGFIVPHNIKTIGSPVKVRRGAHTTTIPFHEALRLWPDDLPLYKEFNKKSVLASIQAEIQNPVLRGTRWPTATESVCEEWKEICCIHNTFGNARTLFSSAYIHTTVPTSTPTDWCVVCLTTVKSLV